jgi:hypothetical protein
MQKFYDLLGRLLFPRQQGWERRKGAKAMLFTVVFSLVFGLIVAEVMRVAYHHGH